MQLLLLIIDLMYITLMLIDYNYYHYNWKLLQLKHWLIKRVKTLTDKLVKDPVVELIEFVDIELEIFIFVDDIAVVCYVPVLIILPLIDNDPEQLILFTLDIFPLIIYNNNIFKILSK